MDTTVTQKDTFVICDYLELLKESDQKKGKYICPVCEGHNLSIAKDGRKYKCWDSCEGKQIAYKLRELNGEFKKRKTKTTENNSTEQSQANQGSGNTGGKGTKAKDLETNVEALDFIESIWGDKLRFNLRSLTIELDGKNLNADTIHTTLAENYRVNITKDRAISTVYHIAIRNEYDPVKVYLESCQNIETGFQKKGIANYLFNIEDDYYDELVWVFLLGLVKRVFEPGCKWDNALILQGDMGIGKSCFFRALMPDYFSDAMTSKLNIDDMRIMHKYAINEWSELNSFTNKQYETVIRGFMSRQEDEFRLPYAKEIITYPRKSVLCGTVNEAQFLTDIAGNRRFMVIPVTKIILPSDLACIRKEIFSAVISDYLENWQGPINDICLSDDAKTRQKAENENYRTTDILEDAIAQYLEGKEEIFLIMAEVLTYLLNWNEGVLGLRGIDRGTQMRVGKILNHLGWVKKAKWINEKTVKVWVHNSQK